MSDIKIFVTYSPNQKAMRLEHPLFYHVIAGSDFQTQEVPQGFYQDNTGDNISSLNPSYCELTTQYWAWKNMEADYYGFCHYRRYFSFSKKQLEQSAWGTVEYDYLHEQAVNELNLEESKMGMWHADKRNGAGKLKLKNGDVYEGLPPASYAIPTVISPLV